MPKKKNDYTFRLFNRDAKDFASYPHCGDRDALAITITALNAVSSAGFIGGIVSNAITVHKLGNQDRRLGADTRRAVEHNIGVTLSWLTRLAHECGTTIEDCAKEFTISNEERLAAAAEYNDDDSAKAVLKRRRLRK